MCIGQLKTETKNNEITTIPQILDLLEIKGSIITTDTMGTQKAIAEKIIDKEAHYILAVKDNQKTLCEEVHAACKRYSPIVDMSETDKGHGRIETRRCQVFEKRLMADDEHNWNKLQSVIKITSSREIRGKVTTEERYCISSLDTSGSLLMFSSEIIGRLKINSTPEFWIRKSKKNCKYAIFFVHFQLNIKQIDIKT
jgi:hypothetical protein